MIPSIQQNFTLSICMIVKNGAEWIAHCLESISQIASEIIIVDTGSTDRTIEIAQHYNASVFHFSWNDDFAAARNFSLSKAKSDWILVLDHDEELMSNHCLKLTKLINFSHYDIYYLNLISDSVDKIYRTTCINTLPRLFRNHLGIQYEGRIHEQLIQSAEKIGAKIGKSDLTIIHHGYQERRDEKFQRNLRILRTEVESNSQNVLAWFHLGETYSLLNRNDEAILAYDNALKSERLPDYLVPIALVNYGNALTKLGNYSEAIKKCQQAIYHKEDLAMAHVIIALAYLKLNQSNEVIKYLENAVHIMNSKVVNQTLAYEVLPDMKYVRTVLAHNCAAIGAKDKAIKYYEQAIQLGSQFYDTYTGLADVNFKEKKYDRALKNYQQAYLLGAREDTIYIKLMQCYTELGNATKAIEMISPLVKQNYPITVNDRYTKVVELAKKKQAAEEKMTQSI
jgi:glycosyltransferase involved in cell wall biosynthesis